MSAHVSRSTGGQTMLACTHERGAGPSVADVCSSLAWRGAVGSGCAERAPELTSFTFESDADLLARYEQQLIGKQGYPELPFEQPGRLLVASEGTSAASFSAGAASAQPTTRRWAKPRRRRPR